MLKNQKKLHSGQKKRLRTILLDNFSNTALTDDEVDAGLSGSEKDMLLIFCKLIELGKIVPESRHEKDYYQYCVNRVHVPSDKAPLSKLFFRDESNDAADTKPTPNLAESKVSSKERINFFIDKDDLERLRFIASEDDRTTSSLIRKAIKLYLASL